MGAGVFDPDSPIVPMSISERTLESLKVEVAEAVSAEFAASVRIDVQRTVLERMVYRLTAQVLADRLPPEHETATRRFEFEVPATWWQAYKAVHYARPWVRWWARRHPIRTKTYRFDGTLSVDLQRYRTWPEAPVMPRGWGQPVRVATVDSRAAWVGRV